MLFIEVENNISEVIYANAKKIRSRIRLKQQSKVQKANKLKT